MVLLLLGCRMASEDVASTVESSLQEELDTGTRFQEFDVEVDKVDVVHEEGNVYRGQAVLQYSGEEHRVPVDITVEGRNVMWRIEPDALMFLF